jgi:hypothetical protein
MAGAIVVGDGSGAGPAKASSVINVTPPSPVVTAAATTPVAATSATDGILPWGLLGLAGLAAGLLLGRRSRSSV